MRRPHCLIVSPSVPAADTAPYRSADENLGYYPAIGRPPSQSGSAWCDPQQARRAQPTWCNGGIPQLTDIARHVAKVKQDVAHAIPDPGFSGLAAIDFETWQPVWEWTGCTGPNAASNPYCNASIAKIRAEQPQLNSSAVNAAAGKEWERAARVFMTATIEAAKETRPQGTWGYYDYPSCGDAAGEYSGADVDCPSGMKAGNEKLAWMYSTSDALYPYPPI